MRRRFPLAADIQRERTARIAASQSWNILCPAASRYHSIPRNDCNLAPLAWAFVTAVRQTRATPLLGGVIPRTFNSNHVRHRTHPLPDREAEGTEKHSEATQKRMPCLNHSLSAPHIGEGGMRGAREYPKIIAERARSSAEDCWQEFLRLTPNEDGTATLAVCRYEVLASAEYFANERGEVNLPDQIAGKTVVGVEGDWIVGGELICCGAGWTYSLTEISSAIDWVRVNGWVPTSCMETQIFRAAFVAAHLVKSEGATLSLAPN